MIEEWKIHREEWNRKKDFNWVQVRGCLDAGSFSLILQKDIKFNYWVAEGKLGEGSLSTPSRKFIFGESFPHLEDLIALKNFMPCRVYPEWNSNALNLNVYRSKHNQTLDMHKQEQPTDREVSPWIVIEFYGRLKGVGRERSESQFKPKTNSSHTQESICDKFDLPSRFPQWKTARLT